MNHYVSRASAWSYQHLVKPMAFQFDAETVHGHITWLGVQLGQSHLAQTAMARLWSYQSPRLSKTIDGISFPNPVGLSAGFDYEGELTQILPAVGFGWHTIGTITYLPYAGNPKPRLSRFPQSQALLVNKGLKNLGAAETIRHLKKITFKIPTGISIASTNQPYDSTQQQITDIIRCFQAFEKSQLKHVYYELNISCPNTFGGEPFNEPFRLSKLLTQLDKINIKRPVYVKFPIDQSEAESLKLLHIIARHHIKGVILGNLTKDRHNQAVTAADLKVWRTRQGNLSGKPTWKRSNRLIAFTRREFGNRFTIIGTGGVFSGKDAQTKLDLGADLVQLITGMVYQGPQLIGQINQTLDQT